MNLLMVDKYKYSTSGLFNFAQDSYLERTSRPIYALIFLLPFIVFYELGTILINTDVLNQTQDRVVAFIWLQSFLDEYLGLGSKFAWVMSPLTVVIVLIALQLVSRKRWYFGFNDVGLMTVECILLAVPLIVLSLLLSGPAESQSNVSQVVYSPTQPCTNWPADKGPTRTSDARKFSVQLVRGEADLGKRSHAVPRCDSYYVSVLRPLGAAKDELRPLDCARGRIASCVTRTTHNARRTTSLLANIVTGVGAGIYEELIFRLILMCILMMLFQDILRLDRKNSIILSVLVSAALFSAHHHIVFVNGQFAPVAPFNWPEFGFRTIAGVYFAVLFAIRGFGITAGTHAFYDIIATVINAVFFQQ